MRHGSSNYVDPEDMFNDTRMSFGEHLEDLRVHLIRAGVGFLIGMTFSLIFLSKPVLSMIQAPVKEQLFEYSLRNRDRRQRELSERAEGMSGLSSIQFKYKIDSRPLVGAIAEQLGLPSPKKGIATPVVEGTEDLLRQLGIYHWLDDKAKRRSHWVTVPIQISDPYGYLKALTELKPYFDPIDIVTFTITETVFVYFKVGLLTGLVVSSPWVFYQIWAFIAAGLYSHEKRLVHYYMPFSLGLFLGGVVLCQVFVIPKAIGALLWFNEWLGVEPELRLSDWLSFAIMLPVVFGVSFQTPLVMMFLNKIGLVDVATYREKRRIAWFFLAVFAAVITPTPDPYNMMLLWVPVGLLYELGILLCVWQESKAEDDDGFGAESRMDEMVEV